MSASCEQLSAFVDGELPPAEADAFRAHLGTCSECARDLHGAMMLEAVETSPRSSVGGRGGAQTTARERAASRWLFRASGPLLIAAGVALWVARSSHDPGNAPVASTLSDYSLAITGGDRTTRGADSPPTGTLDLRRDSALELVLRPSKPVEGAVSAHGFLVQGEDARAWNPPMAVSSAGAIRIAGPAGDLLGVPAGTWDVLLVVGRAETLPSDPQSVAHAAAGPAGEHPWQLLRARVRLGP